MLGLTEEKAEYKSGQSGDNCFNMIGFKILHIWIVHFSFIVISNLADNMYHDEFNSMHYSLPKVRDYDWKYLLN